MKNAKRLIAVIGDSECSAEAAELAYAAGKGIAQKGHVLLCGGYSGIMEAAARGVKDAGGLTVGILSGKTKQDMNTYIDIPIITGLGEARNAVIARSADGVLAIGGGYGTLSEIAFCLKFEVPLVGLRTWSLSHPETRKMGAFPTANTPQEALQTLLSKI